MALPSPLLEQFRAYLKDVRSESTAQKYTQAAMKFLEFCSKNRLSLERLPSGVLTLFSEYLTHNGLAPKSVHTHTAGAKKFIRWLQAKNLIKSTPFTDPDLPRITHELPNTLSEADLVTFLGMANAQSEPHRTAIMLLPFCGLRSDELTHLTLSSLARVDAPGPDGKSIQHVCFSVRGKGGDMRAVPLLPDGKFILIAYLAKWRKFFPGKWLFPSPSGNTISNRTLRYYVQGIRERIGKSGERLTPHTMRRTYATTLLRYGVDVPTLTRIMGHKSVQTTMNHYLDIQPVDMAGAVGRSGAALISRGVYADQVAKAGVDVGKFLSSLPKGTF